MAMESNIFQWIGGSIDMTLNTFVQVTSGKVISSFMETFILMGAITFSLLALAIATGYAEGHLKTVFKWGAKFAVISGLALNAPTYLGWVVEALRGLETGVADAFSASGSTTAATSIYQVLDKAVTDGFNIGADMAEKMGKREFYEIGAMFWDLINAISIYVATLVIAIPAGGMVIVSKIMLTIMLGIGPFFIAMLLFGQATAKWFDSWFAQVMTYIMQSALVTTVLGMGMKFFSTKTAEVLADKTDHPIATFLELLVIALVTLFLLKQAYQAGAALAGGMSAAGFGLREMAHGAMTPGRTMNNIVNPMTTRRDLQSGQMTTARAANHYVAGNTMWNPAYRQHIKDNIGKNWGPANGGSAKKG